jgi:IAA-amino acid hydrolase
MMFLGIRNEALGSVHNLHSPDFKLDEAVLPLGAALHASLAASYLQRRAEGFDAEGGGGGGGASSRGRTEL